MVENDGDAPATLIDVRCRIADTGRIRDHCGAGEQRVSGTMPSIANSPIRQSCARGVRILLGFMLVAVPCSVAWGQSGPPDLKTPAPVIHLADNLDEQDRLGYCIDTVGRGFGELLHAHSCKPRGGDVQFAHDSDTRRIMSATFTGKCAELLAPPAPGVALGLVDCATDSAGQDFDYDGDERQFRPGSDRTLCLAVGESSRSAGPFMSRDLLLAPCGTTSARFRQWVIREDLP